MGGRLHPLQSAGSPRDSDHLVEADADRSVLDLIDLGARSAVRADADVSTPDRRRLAPFKRQRLANRSHTFRAVYTVRLQDSVYVLHAFQRKSKRGIAPPQSEVDLIKRGLKQAVAIGEGLKRDGQEKDDGEKAYVVGRGDVFQDLGRPTPFGRRTFVLRHSGNAWRIVHLHASSLVLLPPKPSSSTCRSTPCGMIETSSTD